MPYALINHVNAPLQTSFFVITNEIGLRVLEWQLIKPFFKYLNTFYLLMLSLAQTYSKVIISFRGMLRKTFK
jgi:hypothetical protein